VLFTGENRKRKRGILQEVEDTTLQNEVEKAYDWQRRKWYKEEFVGQEII
jgi:hypothetical protein